MTNAEPVQKSLVKPCSSLQLNLHAFTSVYFKEEKKRRMVDIFCAARDLLDQRGNNVAPEDVYLNMEEDIPEEEFCFLYIFMKDILHIFSRGEYTWINRNSEFVIPYRLAC